MPTTIRRILKRALDTEELRIITSDELLALPAEAYKQEFGGRNTDIPPFRLRHVPALWLRDWALQRLPSALCSHSPVLRGQSPTQA